MIIFPPDYPTNYDFLSDAEKKRILEEAKYYNDMKMYKEYHQFCDKMAEKNIFVEYGWVGHRNEVFLATYEDAWSQEDWCFQCAD